MDAANVGAHWRDVLCPGRGDLEGSEESFAGGEVGAVEHSAVTSGSNRRRYSATSSSLPVKVLVAVRFDYPGRRAELVHAGAVDALVAEQLL